MQQFRFSLSTQAALMATVAAAFPIAGHAGPAARVDFAVGDVAAVNGAGQSRSLAKGAQIDEGETINTNNGRAQLRFTDGAYVSLQPQSEFRIDQYRYEGRQDGSEKTFLSLLKGGLRTITGFVGRSNRKNYQVSTTVATIGIRGTEYTIRYDKSISGTVGEGEIEVCNGAGCINVTNGESYYVANQDVRPQLSNKGTDLPPDPPPSPPALIREVERVGVSGVDCLIDPASCPIPGLLTGTQNLDVAKVDLSLSRGPIKVVSPGAAVVFDERGTLTNLNGLVPDTFSLSRNDGVMAWGTFADSSGLLTHFVAGLPVPLADLAKLGNSTGTYSLISGTAVTDASNNQIGTLDSAILTVAFGVGSVSANMNWTISGLQLSAALTGTGTGTAFSASGTCGLSCSANANILLFGANAARAGMIYDISDPILSIQGVGAAALTDSTALARAQ